jgi:hypothetical protein
VRREAHGRCAAPGNFPYFHKAAAADAAAALLRDYWPVGSDSCVIGSLLRLKLPPPG